jgi:hypothetical protein
LKEANAAVSGSSIRSHIRIHQAYGETGGHEGCQIQFEISLMRDDRENGKLVLAVVLSQ